MTTDAVPSVLTLPSSGLFFKDVSDDGIGPDEFEVEVMDPQEVDKDVDAMCFNL